MSRCHSGGDGGASPLMGETAADAGRTRAGRRPHDRDQRDGRGPDAGVAVSPSAPSARWERAWGAFWVEIIKIHKIYHIQINRYEKWTLGSLWLPHVDCNRTPVERKADPTGYRESTEQSSGKMSEGCRKPPPPSGGRTWEPQK
eukprot:gene16851-biopygen21832